jgi:uncharacterized protein
MIRTDLRFPRHTQLASLVAEATASGQLAHDHLHVERVYRWCVYLADQYQADVELAGAAGLLHDLVHIPKSSPDRPLGSEQSAAAAGGLLQQSGYTTEQAAAVVEAIRTCSWSRGLSPTADLGRILQDADRLDAIGAIGIARCFSCAQEMVDSTSALYHPQMPLAANERALDDRQFALDHFAAKLLKLSADMHFPLARQEAQRRHQMLEDFARAMAADVRDPVQDQSCQSQA